MHHLQWFLLYNHVNRIHITFGRLLFLQILHSLQQCTLPPSILPSLSQRSWQLSLISKVCVDWHDHFDWWRLVKHFI